MSMIALCAFWNEKDWVRPSLEQLDALAPSEAIICEGCFDPKFPVHSTDGTREILEQYVDEREFAKLISPVRASAWSAVIRTWYGHSKGAETARLFPARWRTTLSMVRWAAYRRNQALTFSSMIDASTAWAPGNWFMTYDADQFYPDEMLEALRNLREAGEIGLLTARELTFMDGFDQYTMDHERRTFNNMPHRIYPSTQFIPTRRIVLEKPLRRCLYIERVGTRHLGRYFHYRFRSPARQRLTYSVGDRMPPAREALEFHSFDDEHPSVVRRHFGL